MPGNRILRSDSSVSPPSSSSTPAQTANAKIQGPTVTTQGCLSLDHNSKGLSLIYWDSQCCSSGDTTRPTILQVPPGIQTPFSETGRGVKQSCTPDRLRQGGAEMMERTSKPMEPSEPSSSSKLDKDNIRCLNLGSGSSLQRCNHRGILVPGRNFLSHQLPGDATCVLSTSILHNRPSLPLDSVPLHGQHFSNFLPQLQGRDNISISQLPCLGDLAMVHVSEHLTSNQPPSRTPQHSSRYRVQDDKGQMRLAITHQNLPEDQSEMGSICSGPVCIQTHTPTASIFQLETRSSAAATDSFLQVWPSQISYGNPPWGLILRVLSEISHQKTKVVIVAPV